MPSRGWLFDYHMLFSSMKINDNLLNIFVQLTYLKRFDALRNTSQKIFKGSTTSII